MTRIEHIDEVLPHVQGRTDFVVGERDGFTVVDYTYTLPDSFSDPMRAECRGIKFGPDGKVLARPFGKFFNIGEKDHTQPHCLDFEQPHLITEKLDGSMIHPAIVNGQVVFMTRMGCTDVAAKAERHLTPQLASECRTCLEAGLTPIFEWTAPDNRIVLHYPDSRLTLLAVRQTFDGGYQSRAQVEGIAAAMGIGAVACVSPEWRDGKSFVEFARAVSNQEGFVVTFSDGLWVKAKGEDYVLQHKAKEQVSLEKNALKLILEGAVDDVLPLLSDDDAARLLTFQTEARAGIREAAEYVGNLVQSGAHLEQKEFAVEHLAEVDPIWRSLAFAVRAGQEPHDAVQDIISRNLGSGTRVESVRRLFNAHMFETTTSG